MKTTTNDRIKALNTMALIRDEYKTKTDKWALVRDTRINLPDSVFPCLSSDDWESFVANDLTMTPRMDKFVCETADMIIANA